MDLINVALIIIIIIDFILIIISSVGRTKDQNNLVYAIYLINIATVAWWTASMIFYRNASPGMVVALTKNLYISPTFIASSFYYFSLIFPNSTNKHSKKALAVISANLILVLLIIFGNTIIYSVRVNPYGENIIYFGKLYILYIIYFLYLFFTSFGRLFFKHFNIANNNEKAQVFYLFLGYTISGNMAFISNLLLPWFGKFDFNWFGQVATIFDSFFRR